MSLFLICFILYGILTSCVKDKIPKVDASIKIVWRAQLGPERYDQIIRNPAIYKNKLIMGYQSAIDKEGYYIYDKNTGAVLKDLPDLQSFGATAIVYKNQYLSSIGRYVRSINLNDYTFSFTLKPNYSYTTVFISAHDDIVYIPRWGKIDNSPDQNTYEILSYNTLNSKIENFFQDTFASKDALGSFSKYSIFMNLNNQKVMHYAASQSFYSTSKKSLYKVVCLGINGRTKIWETKPFEVDSTDTKNLGNFTPIYFNELVILGISSYLYAFDKYTGEKKWSTYIGQIDFTEVVLHNGKISIQSNDGKLYQIDALMGKILKANTSIRGSSLGWILHKGYFYLTTSNGKLYKIDADTLDIKWEIGSPNKCSYCQFGSQYPVIDSETNRLYITDGLEVICYQLD